MINIFKMEYWEKEFDSLIFGLGLCAKNSLAYDALKNFIRSHKSFWEQQAREKGREEGKEVYQKAYKLAFQRGVSQSELEFAKNRFRIFDSEGNEIKKPYTISVSDAQTIMVTQKNKDGFSDSYVIGESCSISLLPH